MIIRRGGFAEASGMGFDSLLGNSDILAFRYDVQDSRFSVVSGRERAFLGYSRGDWLTADFLESVLNGEDRLAILSLMRNCYSGQQIVRDCTLIDAHGADSSCVIAAIASESDPSKVSGQIIILDPEVVLTRRKVGNQAVNIDLMRGVVAALGQSSRTISGYGDLLIRHLGAQGDDLGGEYALGIQEAITAFSEVLDQIKPLSLGSPTAQEVADVTHALQEICRNQASAIPGAG